METLKEPVTKTGGRETVLSYFWARSPYFKKSENKLGPGAEVCILYVYIPVMIFFLSNYVNLFHQILFILQKDYIFKGGSRLKVYVRWEF